MPNTLTHSLSPHSFPFLSLFVFLEKKELQHIVVFNIYKAGFCYFWKKKGKTLGTHEILLCPLAYDQIPDLYDCPGEGSQTVRNVALLLAWAAPTVTLSWKVPWSCPAGGEQQHRLVLKSKPSSASLRCPCCTSRLSCALLLVTAILLVSQPSPSRPCKGVPWEPCLRVEFT